MARRRHYYDPGSNPFPQKHRGGPGAAPRKPIAHKRHEYTVVGRALAKRERRAKRNKFIAGRGGMEAAE